VDPSVVIVGAGFGGIAAAIELREHGIEDVTLLERASGPGGTWHHNTYPGVACDVPSHLYSFSFAQRKDWSRLCSPGPEIADYVDELVDRFDLRRRMTFDTEVADCSWDEGARRWTLTSTDGRVWTADAVIVATGQLHRPALPRIPGRESLTAHAFHSAEWDHGYDLRGKRVAVIGTGASAVQFTPEVAEAAGHTTVFQRTGNWFMPRRNRAYPKPYTWAVRSVPGFQHARRRFWFWYGEFLTAQIRHPRTLGRIGQLVSTVFMRLQLRDPEVRRKAWPDYTFGCKRVLFSSAFLPALQRSDVELVTEPIAAIEGDEIVTADGRRRPVDCVIWGTGFRTTDFMVPMEIHGRDGRSLADAWEAGAHAHLGIAVPGFPALFLMYGPNTNTSGGSILTYHEAQAGYIRQAIETMARTGAAVDVRPEVETASDRALQARFGGTAWTACDSWYRDETGRIVTNWPGFMREYIEATETFDPAEYALR
jgi:cation diffusion facilitator CzcD-associated flavoprotein CzcO